jgi:hypothetical protein
MCLFFLSNEGGNLFAVIEEITQPVKNLRFGEIQCIGNFKDRLALKIERGHVPDCDAQAIDDWLASTYAFQANNVRVLGFCNGGHVKFSYPAF